MNLHFLAVSYIKYTSYRVHKIRHVFARNVFLCLMNNTVFRDALLHCVRIYHRFKTADLRKPFLDLETETLSKMSTNYTRPLRHIAKDKSEFGSRLRRRPAAARLLGLRVRIPPRSWICFSSECCVLYRE